MKIGKPTGGGCRSYLAVYGGFPSLAEWFGSKATAPMTGVGGYQGRALTSGDLLGLVDDVPKVQEERKIPDHLIPQYPTHWDLLAMPGPYDVGYLLPEDIEMLFNTERTISHNAARDGIRFIGPKPNGHGKTEGKGVPVQAMSSNTAI